MGKLEEYIESLAGKEGLDPIMVATDLLGLHNEEIGVREAKIEELNGSIVDRDKTLASKDAEITGWKAKNYDLFLQIPGTNQQEEFNKEKEEEVNNANITIDDLFK